MHPALKRMVITRRKRAKQPCRKVLRNQATLQQSLILRAFQPVHTFKCFYQIAPHLFCFITIANQSNCFSCNCMVFCYLTCFIERNPLQYLLRQNGWLRLLQKVGVTIKQQTIQTKNTASRIENLRTNCFMTYNSFKRKTKTSSVFPSTADVLSSIG